MDKIIERIIEELLGTKGDCNLRACNRVINTIIRIAKEYLDDSAGNINCLSDKLTNNDWIPISSGRLPEIDEEVIICFDTGEVYACTQDWKRGAHRLEYGDYTEDGEWYVKRVVAWRPLPEPYHPQEKITTGSSIGGDNDENRKGVLENN